MKELNIDNKTVEKVIKIISQVSFNGQSVTPDIIEDKKVQDADRLDALGAIEIARAFAYGGSKNRIMYNPNDKPVLNMTKEESKNNRVTTLNHFYEKLFLLKDFMNTKTGKEIAIERNKYMREFVDKFIDEWNGI